MDFIQVTFWSSLADINFTQSTQKLDYFPYYFVINVLQSILSSGYMYHDDNIDLAIKSSKYHT